MTKILILRFSSIGDIVLTTPVVRTLKTQLPALELHYATKPQFVSILAQNPYIDKIYTLEPKKTNELIKKLKQEKYNYIIDLHHNQRTFYIKWRLGVKSYAFPKLNWQKWVFVNFKKNFLPNVHIVDRYMQAVAPLGVKMDNLGLDFFIAEEDEFELSWLPSTHQKGFVVYALGGTHATKRLPLNRMIELCDKINKPIILLGGKEDYEIAQQLCDFFEKDQASDFEKVFEKLNKKARIFNLCGKLNLGQSASLVKQAQVVFTHDTGLMHIAAAFRKKIYSIWGSTSPHFGMYPYRTSFVVFENNNLSCRPCSKIGYSKCPKGHFKCLNEVVFDFWLP
jgi:ADP-heptose:LPS heptosyltransferase